MAKGNGNPAGKRPTSRNAKPYDANNSFVRKMATKVTDFIPQSSWISKWFNTSQSNEDTLDVKENPEEPEITDDTQQPPPIKRPCIRMDVIHPPGTFSIQPRGKTALNTVDSSKEQYSVHNETSNFLEPSTAGPSGIGRLISSTSVIQADIRTVTSHRSDLNSLTSPTNNGTANGTDDHSESSESTSGCSSLIPQINRHEGPSNLLYNSTFSNRKRHIDDKLTFTNHLQSPRSLFLDSNSRDTLSSRRPSFNASVMANVLDRASPLSSPFYSGNITYGGANTAGLYKQGRSLFNDSSELQLKVPRRTKVEVKPSSAAEVDSSGMSQTAKKILEALEHFSSPISDAKKIPLKNTDDAFPMNRKRAREEAASPSARIGLRHLTRELTIPTVPDILKLKRRQKLQDTTLAARKIVSACSDPRPSAQEYQLRTEDGDREKYHGKIRGKSKRNLEEEETVEPVNLPNIPLPISTLPNFNFTLPLAPRTLDKITTTKEDTFTFASPIKVTDAGKNLQSSNHFTFSNPINAEDNVDSIIESSSLTKIENAMSVTSSISSTTMSMPNFIWSGSSTAPRLKEKTKSSKDFPARESKPGSVMDVLCPKSDKTEFNLSAQSNAISVPETVRTDNAAEVKCAADTEYSDSITNAAESLDWECSECLIRNSNSNKQCTACKIARPNPNEKISLPTSTADSAVKTKPVANDCFGSQFKLSASQWECTACYVRNKQNDAKCVACSTPRLGSTTGTQQATASTVVKSAKSDLMEKFKPAEGSWECSGCLLRNAANVITCPCCNTSKPVTVKVNAKKTDATATVQLTSTDAASVTTTESSNSEITNKSKSGKESWECPGCSSIIQTANKRAEQTLTTNGFGDKFKKPEGAWNCDTCMLQNDAKHTKCVACETPKPGTTKSSISESMSSTSSVQFKFGVLSGTSEFKFGIDKADNQPKSESASLNGFKFGNVQSNNGTAQFTFGIPKEEKVANDVPKTSSVATSSGSSGFQFNVKNPEKSDPKSDQEIKQNTSFGVPKTESSNTISEKQSTSIMPSTVSTSTSFTFGTQKPGFNQITLNKEAPKVSFGVTNTQDSKVATVSTVSDTSAISTNTTLPSLFTQSYTSQSDTKPTPVFSFGVPSTTNSVASSSNASLKVTTTTCLPSFAQSSFTFPPDSKTAPQTATASAFAQIPTSSSTLPPNLSFGNSKLTETSTLPSSNKTAVSDAPPTASTFPIVSSTTPLFNSNESKPPMTFSAENPSVFANTSNDKPGFSMAETKLPAFGSSATENKPTTFGMPESKPPVFGSIPVFNSSGQASTVNPLSTFGASSSAAPSPFGSFASGSSFGNNAGANATPAFAATNTPAIFPSSTKPNESNVTANSTSLFTFGSNQSTQQPAGGGFNFSANVNSAASTSKQQLFTFGNNSSTPQSNSVFGGGTFANPASNTVNFAFNAPKQETSSTFGQSAVATPMFGANPQTQATSSFSSTPSSSTGFNFGSAAPPAALSGGFNFGGMSSTSTSTGGYNFNPPTSTPTVAFDPNSRPSFNFTKGSAPTSFNAPPQSATAAPRKIKKAFRRVVR